MGNVQSSCWKLPLGSFSDNLLPTEKGGSQADAVALESLVLLVDAVQGSSASAAGRTYFVSGQARGGLKLF